MYRIEATKLHHLPRIIEYPKLEWGHEGHQVQLLATLNNEITAFLHISPNSVSPWCLQ